VDLLVRHGPKDVEAKLASTGEQKALLIGLILAQARLVRQETGRAAILLLDEIAAHLDERRRAALYDLCTDLGGQTFMTGTDARCSMRCQKVRTILPLTRARSSRQGRAIPLLKGR
jgi:DNA replication and repair protein RecF